MDQMTSIKTVIEEEEEVEYIAVPEIFSYQYFQTHRYEISQKDGYQCLCNNGWIKFFTLKTRVYWHTQNQFSHRVPDWKFHVSVNHEDVKKAWDLIIGLFIKMKCRAGVKVIYLKQSVNPHPGRQITIYIVKYSKSFQKSKFANDFQICIADQHSEDFWIQMISQIQRVLSAHQIRTNGLAQGDLKIAKYTSLRNEAFVLDNDGNYVYPGNSHGWNHENQRAPFNISFLIEKVEENQQEESCEKKKKSLLPYLTLPIMILSFGFVWLKKIKKF